VISADADLDVTLQAHAADRFDPLSEAERKLLAAASAGLDVNCGPDGLTWETPENDPAHADAWGHDRTIRASLLAWLCADVKATKQIHHFGIRLTGARIDGVFDISFVSVPFPLSFSACFWPQGMRLRGTAIPELRLPRCRIGLLPDGEGQKTAIMAAGLRVQNSVYLCDGFQAEGEVSLRGADIGGLDCSRGSRFKNEGGPALNAELAKIGGPVFLRDDFQAEGEVSLLDADTGGLQCRGSRFKNPNGPALNAERAKIGAPVFLRDDFEAEGEVLLRGADINGALECGRGSRFKNPNGRALNAERAKIGGPVFLREHFQAEGEVRLRDADIIGGLDCGRGSRFKNPNGPALNAERAKIGGSVLLCSDFESEGEVLLRNADIGGLECSRGSRLKSPSGPALNAALAKISSPVLLRDDFEAEGEVLLRDADIGGLACSGGSQFKNPKGRALNAERAKIGAPVFLRDDFEAEGEVLLRGADINGALECSRGSRLKNVGGPALNAERAKIDGPLLLRDDFQAEGGVRLQYATVRGAVEIENRRPAATDGTSTFGLNLYGARIDGALVMRGLRCDSDTVVDLEDTSCNVLVDTKEGWPPAGQLRLDGFVYRRLRDPLTPAIRLDWLRRVLPPDEGNRRGRFRPQPYRQLAGVLRAQGLDAEAKEVLIGMAEDRRKWADLGKLSHFWQWVLWITIRNGHQPLRAGYGLLTLWFVGFLAFGLGYQMQVMVPSERFAYDGFAQGVLPGQYEPFCALIYSIDTSLPIIGFGQKDRWHPRLMENPPPRGGYDGFHGLLCKADFTRRLDPKSVWISRATLADGLEVYRWFHLALGWFLATMLLAGISGLVGRE
jgi:hypothetical protein